jgi:hypothetical protein
MHLARLITVLLMVTACADFEGIGEGLANGLGDAACNASHGVCATTNRPFVVEEIPPLVPDETVYLEYDIHHSVARPFIYSENPDVFIVSTTPSTLSIDAIGPGSAQLRARDLETNLDLGSVTVTVDR